MTSATPVLEAREIAVHFGGVKAVDGVTLRLSPNLIYGVMGPNGSGKSTLVGAITRLTPLTRGELLFDGKPFHHLRPSGLAALRVARTFQTVRLLADLTVRQNIQLGAEARELGRAWSGPHRRRQASSLVARRVDSAIERTGLQRVTNYYPSELPYGTQRRVEIARAIAMEPRVLMLDEPTAGMNHAERAEISKLLRELRSDGLCQFIVEHDVQMMIDTCDYIFAMNTGKMIAEGTPSDVVRDPLVQAAYLGGEWHDA